MDQENRTGTSEVAHKDIRFKFELEGRRYEAVGFLKPGESQITGYAMLRRVSVENGGAVGEEEVRHICLHANKLPTGLRAYYLATNQRPRSNRKLIVGIYFDKDVGEWHNEAQSLLNLKQFSKNVLVLRRCQ